MEIPTEQLKWGIIHCIYSSQSINDLSERIFKQYEEELSKGGTSLQPKYSVVMFYYAIEELGKAILIEEKMIQALKRESKKITVERHFGSHDDKIYKAQERYPELGIQRLIPEYDINEKTIIDRNKVKFFKLIPDGDIIPSFTDRSNLWLTTFDEAKNEWLYPVDDFDIDELRDKIRKLDKILEEWRQKYT